jgi:hypothetical protein
MILRRQYFKNRKYAWYFHPEIKTYHELLEFAERNPNINVDALDTATYYMDKLTKEEQNAYFAQSCVLILNHTRWVLDNLDNMCEFKVRWNNYGGHNGTTIGLPPSKEENRQSTLNAQKPKAL